MGDRRSISSATSWHSSVPPMGNPPSVASKKVCVLGLCDEPDMPYCKTTGEAHLGEEYHPILQLREELKKRKEEHAQLEMKAAEQATWAEVLLSRIRATAEHPGSSRRSSRTPLAQFPENRKNISPSRPCKPEPDFTAQLREVSATRRQLTPPTSVPEKSFWESLQEALSGPGKSAATVGHQCKVTCNGETLRVNQLFYESFVSVWTSLRAGAMPNVTVTLYPEEKPAAVSAPNTPRTGAAHTPIQTPQNSHLSRASTVPPLASDENRSAFHTTTPTPSLVSQSLDSMPVLDTQVGHAVMTQPSNVEQGQQPSAPVHTLEASRPLSQSAFVATTQLSEAASLQPSHQASQQVSVPVRQVAAVSQQQALSQAASNGVSQPVSMVSQHLSMPDSSQPVTQASQQMSRQSELQEQMLLSQQVSMPASSQSATQASQQMSRQSALQGQMPLSQHASAVQPVLQVSQESLQPSQHVSEPVPLQSSQQPVSQALSQPIPQMSSSALTHATSQHVSLPMSAQQVTQHQLSQTGSQLASQQVSMPASSQPVTQASQQMSRQSALQSELQEQMLLSQQVSMPASSQSATQASQQMSRQSALQGQMPLSQHASAVQPVLQLSQESLQPSQHMSEPPMSMVSQPVSLVSQQASVQAVLQEPLQTASEQMHPASVSLASQEPRRMSLSQLVPRETVSLHPQGSVRELVRNMTTPDASVTQIREVRPVQQWSLPSHPSLPKISEQNEPERHSKPKSNVHVKSESPPQRSEPRSATRALAERVQQLETALKPPDAPSFSIEDRIAAIESSIKHEKSQGRERKSKEPSPVPRSPAGPTTRDLQDRLQRLEEAFEQATQHHHREVSNLQQRVTEEKGARSDLEQEVDFIKKKTRLQLAKLREELRTAQLEVNEREEQVQLVSDLKIKNLREENTRLKCATMAEAPPPQPRPVDHIEPELGKKESTVVPMQDNSIAKILREVLQLPENTTLPLPVESVGRPLLVEPLPVENTSSVTELTSAEMLAIEMTKSAEAELQARLRAEAEHEAHLSKHVTTELVHNQQSLHALQSQSLPSQVIQPLTESRGSAPHDRETGSQITAKLSISEDVNLEPEGPVSMPGPCNSFTGTPLSSFVGDRPVLPESVSTAAPLSSQPLSMHQVPENPVVHQIPIPRPQYQYQHQLHVPDPQQERVQQRPRRVTVQPPPRPMPRPLSPTRPAKSVLRPTPYERPRPAHPQRMPTRERHPPAMPQTCTQLPGPQQPQLQRPVAYQQQVPAQPQQAPFLDTSSVPPPLRSLSETPTLPPLPPSPRAQPALPPNALDMLGSILDGSHVMPAAPRPPSIMEPVVSSDQVTQDLMSKVKLLESKMLDLRDEEAVLELNKRRGISPTRKVPGDHSHQQEVPVSVPTAHTSISWQSQMTQPTESANICESVVTSQVSEEPEHPSLPTAPTSAHSSVPATASAVSVSSYPQSSSISAPASQSLPEVPMSIPAQYGSERHSSVPSSRNSSAPRTMSAHNNTTASTPSVPAEWGLKDSSILTQVHIPDVQSAPESQAAVTIMTERPTTPDSPDSLRTEDLDVELIAAAQPLKLPDVSSIEAIPPPADETGARLSALALQVEALLHNISGPPQEQQQQPAQPQQHDSASTVPRRKFW
eukprot:TRINITY_DN9358_c2_g1_i7.p1 TRINITY_DN9358_c2_g1~~TRINITY_DN9358_c2_g1_i7.p1  ORF type:complete len:1635 (+),score=330.08 TRINITY_DN9358_c2_g1_i7:89-4993(+)